MFLGDITAHVCGLSSWLKLNFVKHLSYSISTSMTKNSELFPDIRNIICKQHTHVRTHTEARMHTYLPTTKITVTFPRQAPQTPIYTCTCMCEHEWRLEFNAGCVFFNCSPPCVDGVSRWTWNSSARPDGVMGELWGSACLPIPGATVLGSEPAPQPNRNG